jgi:hypothetical protein
MIINNEILLMYRKKLDNGVSVQVTDQSRQIAGDRWYIKIVCSVTMPVKEGMLTDRGGDGPELLTRICDCIGDEARKDFVLERNFVDEREKDDVTDELLARIKENIKGYLSLEKFPSLFLDSCYDEARIRCQCSAGVSLAEQPGDDEGPADFSGCFRD